ncbi:hypothetical protein CPB84DRAFT_1761487 [Gymnopilus junonius]|uniref:Secreted protein n=1 Tax=Gymnopilus junonius TaxID=109634 RepID=A0A9P5TTC7_GYMJU|nr:hypothetical protein CPB84DRAFT_1761487 [Gymnopilus junonius]
MMAQIRIIFIILPSSFAKMFVTKQLEAAKGVLARRSPPSSKRSCYNINIFEFPAHNELQVNQTLYVWCLLSIAL